MFGLFCCARGWVSGLMTFRSVRGQETHAQPRLVVAESAALLAEFAYQRGGGADSVGGVFATSGCGV